MGFYMIDNSDSQVIRNLQDQISDLKQSVTQLAEAAHFSNAKELSWVYALEGNRDGVWDWNPTTDEVYFSQRWKEMLGFAGNEIQSTVEEWECRIHPNDRAAVYVDLNAHLDGHTTHYENEHRLRCKDGCFKWILDRGKVLSWTEDGKPLRFVGTHTDVTARKEADIENERLLNELGAALLHIKHLSGLLPICASCKSIRDDKGAWVQMEAYIRARSDAEFSHGICPECTTKPYPDD